MTKKILILLTLLIVLSSCQKDESTAEVQEIEEVEELEEAKVEAIENVVDYSEYHNEIDKVADKLSVYGMQVVVFKDEDILDSYNYGYADIKNETKVNDDTVFRIASTSKMISNMLVMKLVDEGKLSLNSNLKELTGLAFDDNVKLYHILTHTSGLADSSVFNDNLDSIFDLDYLLKISKVSKPGEQYIYSNFAAGTMAAIIESVTGEYFMDYAQRELFDYLDLNAAYVADYLDEGTEIAKMYLGDEVFDPKTWLYNKDFHMQFELGKQYRLPYGSLLISGKDLAVLGMVLANDGSYKGKKVLSQNTLNEIKTARDKAIGYKYLMALNTNLFFDLVEDKIIYGHTGSAYGAITCLVYDSISHSGVVALTNHASSANNDIGYNALLYDVVNLAYKYVLSEE